MALLPPRFAPRYGIFITFEALELTKLLMIYAVKNEELVKAEPKKSAVCPLCSQPVFSVIEESLSYWSHLTQANCDPWVYLETAWSIGWKKQFLPQYVDVPVLVEDQSHFADVRNSSGVIFKLSPVFPKDPIVPIEYFFGGRMVWIIDALAIGMTEGATTPEKSLIDLPTILTTSRWHESERPLFFDIRDTSLLYFESGADFELRLGKIIEKERFLKKYAE